MVADAATLMVPPLLVTPVSPSMVATVVGVMTPPYAPVPPKLRAAVLPMVTAQFWSDESVSVPVCPPVMVTVPALNQPVVPLMVTPDEAAIATVPALLVTPLSPFIVSDVVGVTVPVYAPVPP